MLGYSPCVDLLLQSTSSSDRLWIEFEVSRADPVANHAKFASAHLIQSLPESDVFVSLVSNDVAKGRANLSAHAVYLLRVAGLRAFQMTLLPVLDGAYIKRLNQGKTALKLLPDPNIREVIDLTRPIGRREPGKAEIYYATNRLEVLLNLHQWNRDIADEKYRSAWGKRKVRYLVADIKSGRFAPSKFCAYTRMPGNKELFASRIPAMTIPAYSKIEQSNTIFDGQKARLRLETLGFHPIPATELPSQRRVHLKSWATLHQTSLILDLENTVILQTSA